MTPEDNFSPDDIVMFQPDAKKAETHNPIFIRAVNAANYLSYFYQRLTQEMMRETVVDASRLPPRTDDANALQANGVHCDPDWGLAAYKVFTGNMERFFCRNPAYATTMRPKGYDIAKPAPACPFASINVYEAEGIMLAHLSLPILNSYAMAVPSPAIPRFTN